MAAKGVTVLLLTVLSCAVALGGVINVSSSSALNAANNDAVAGDTVKLAAGTYTVAINPTNSGTFGSPIVYMPATAGAVCSLYTSTSCVSVSGVDYIIIQDIRMQINPTSDYTPVHFFQTNGSALLRCRVYGGTTNDLSGRGSFFVVLVSRSSYCRIIGNYVDRQDPILDNDGSWLKEDRRGDGIGITAEDESYVPTNDSKYNIIEGNTVTNVSHYGIDPNYGTGLTPSMNITRRNTVYNTHVGIGTINQNVLTLVEGNRVWSPGQKCQHRPGLGWEGTGIRTIIRYNMFADDSTAPTNNSLYSANATGTQEYYAVDSANRYYNNAFLGASRNNYEWHAFSSERPDGPSGDLRFGHSVFVNNIFGPTTQLWKSQPYYWKDAANVGAARDTMRYNLFYVADPSDTVAVYEHGSVYYYTLAQAKAAEVTFESSNLAGSPLWVDSLSIRGSRSYQIAANSRCVDAGGALTTVASNVSSSTVVTVGDAWYFHYDWGANPYDRGDSVLIGTNRCELDSVDYDNNRLILKSAITVSAGAGVHVLATYSTESESYITRLSGSAPDIGPYERTTSGGGTSIPGSTTLVAPDSGGTQSQPITFRWRAVSGATKYWISISEDNWTTLKYGNSAITDTFVVVSGLTPGAVCVWNVATGNDAGWNTDAWSSWWTVEIAESPVYPDTLTVNWNNVFESETLTDNTVIQMANLQRRDNVLVIKNPSGRLIDWPTTIRWPGLETAPQPAAGDTVAYWLIRDGVNVYGFVLGSQASSSSGVTAGWVNQQVSPKADTNSVPRVFNVMRYGADPTGSSDSRESIQRAIDAAASSGGGTVYFPDGSYRVSTPTKTTAGDIPVIYLYSTSSGVSFVGSGRGTTRVFSDSPGALLYVGNVDSSGTEAARTGIYIEGITFEYTGGFRQADSAYGWGVFVSAKSGTISGCSFRNFLNGLYVRANSQDVVVDNNLFEWDHGRASVSYPSNESQGGFLYPTVGLRNYGVRTRISNNTVNCVVDTNFSTASGSPPDSMRIPADGFVHGTGLGGLVTNNTVKRFAYEGILIEDGASVYDGVRKTIVSNNFIDGTMPGFVSHATNMARVPGKGFMGGWGIRVDGGNAIISGNTIVGAWHAISTDTVHSGPGKNTTISNNSIWNCPSGIYLNHLQGSSVIGNTVGPYSPTQAMKDSGLSQLYGIALVNTATTFDNVISANNVHGSLRDWYHKTTTATGTNAASQNRVYCSSTSGVSVGQYFRVHYSESGIGEFYLIDTVGASFVTAHTALTVTVSSGDTLFFTATYPPFAGSGIVDASFGNNVFQANTTYNTTYSFFGYTASGDTNAVISTVSSSSVAGVATDGLTALPFVGDVAFPSDVTVHGALYGEANIYSSRTDNTQATFNAQNTHGGGYFGVNSTGRVFFARLTPAGAYRDGMFYVDSSASTIHFSMGTDFDGQLYAAGNFGVGGGLFTNLTPSSASTYNLGSATYPWSYLYAANIVIGTAATLPASMVAGDFTAGTNASMTFKYGTSDTSGVYHLETNTSYGAGWRWAGGSNQYQLVRYSGSTTPTVVAYINRDDNNATFAGYVRSTQFRLSALNTAPANAGDTGTLGEIRIVDGYIYVCTATNTWKRAAIATW